MQDGHIGKFVGAVTLNYPLSLITAFVITLEGILNLTTENNLIAEDVYVAYRDQFPDEATVERMKKQLKENVIEYDQLAD
jgi:hypothetical protein